MAARKESPIKGFSMPTLLVIDDEPAILHFFRRAFRAPEVTLVTASTAAEGLEQVAKQRPDVIVLDIHLPDHSGLEIFRRIHQLDTRIPVIFITGHGTTDTAIEAMRLGAYEYLTKPLELPDLRNLIGRAFEISRLMSVPAVVPEGEASAEPERSADILVGHAPAMQAVYKAIGRVAAQDVTVLILGESGTGKELVARAIYHYSRRANGPFLAINCAAIPETLLESELFGHEKGAFTGADRKRIGKFEQCSGGTLFLDEVGDMTSLTQTKILRVLQDGQFERVGGNETIKTDVRVITATNRHLEQMIGDGKFRGDLYYRLNVYTINLPPLRDRLEDLPLLVEHFLRRFSRELGKDVQQIAPDALDLLRIYHWPGNIRELQSALKQALLQTTGPVLVPEFLPAMVRGESKSSEASASTSSLALPELDRFIKERLRAGSRDLYTEVLALIDRHLLTQVLRLTGNRLTQTAQILGINRSTLRSKMKALDIKVESLLPGEEIEEESSD
jgi:nitrogen regulation protein NR(I)